MIRDGRFPQLQVAACSEWLAFKVWQLHFDMRNMETALNFFTEHMRWYKVVSQSSFPLSLSHSSCSLPPSLPLSLDD